MSQQKCNSASWSKCTADEKDSTYIVTCRACTHLNRENISADIDKNCNRENSEDDWSSTMHETPAKVEHNQRTAYNKFVILDTSNLLSEDNFVQIDDDIELRIEDKLEPNPKNNNCTFQNTDDQIHRAHSEVSRQTRHQLILQAEELQNVKELLLDAYENNPQEYGTNILFFQQNMKSDKNSEVTNGEKTVRNLFRNSEKNKPKLSTNLLAYT